MLAAHRKMFGPPSVVSVVDVHEPLPRDGQVLVRVATTSLTRTDCHYRSGRPLAMRAIAGLRSPKAQILGCEFAGTVVELGEGVTRFTVGDRVFGYVEGPFGAHAELLCVSQSASIDRIPANVGFDAAAAATEGAHYAISYLDKMHVADDSKLLVVGARCDRLGGRAARQGTWSNRRRHVQAPAH